MSNSGNIAIAEGLGATGTRLLAGTAAAGIAAGSAAVAYFDPSNNGFFPICPLYKMTGLACPGCGLTRGFHALFHGDIAGALDLNIMTPVWAVILGYILVSLVLTASRGKGLPMWPTNMRFIYGFAMVLFVFGVLRNLPFEPFTYLYP